MILQTTSYACDKFYWQPTKITSAHYCTMFATIPLNFTRTQRQLTRYGTDIGRFVDATLLQIQ